MIPIIPVHTVIIPEVPFYSQFRDITQSSWKKAGCGVTSLAMVINYYDPGSVTVNTLLKEGIASGAYNNTYGWSHRGLINLSETYGLEGESYDLGKLGKTASYEKFKSFLVDGPVIVSVHYKFDPRSSIPHLVVIDGIDGDYLYYNDPAATGGKRKISVTDFQKGWKKKFIVVRPASDTDVNIS